MAPTREVDISQLIDAAPVSALQKRAIALCLALAILDGMDAQLIGFAIPALSEDWGLSKASFGLLLRSAAARWSSAACCSAPSPTAGAGAG